MLDLPLTSLTHGTPSPPTRQDYLAEAADGSAGAHGGLRPKKPPHARGNLQPALRRPTPDGHRPHQLPPIQGVGAMGWVQVVVARVGGVRVDCSLLVLAVSRGVVPLVCVCVCVCSFVLIGSVVLSGLPHERDTGFSLAAYFRWKRRPLEKTGRRVAAKNGRKKNKSFAEEQSSATSCRRFRQAGCCKTCCSARLLLPPRCRDERSMV